ncbi:hypothetical protein UB46_16470 [Burkholderiaceae bacterium 16]|nr:hypothetical protein UB46_16470 [Burkholderiaceae bacterium 16]
MTMNKTKLQPPANLDLSSLHSPTEVRQWESEWQDYRQALVDEQNRERIKEQSAHAESNRNLTDQEYYDLAVKREAKEKERQAERAAAAKAEREAKEAYLASEPDTVDISENSEYLTLLRLQHRFSQGYVTTENSIQAWFPGYYHIVLHKPAPATAKRGSK